MSCAREYRDLLVGRDLPAGPRFACRTEICLQDRDLPAGPPRYGGNTAQVAPNQRGSWPGPAPSGALGSATPVMPLALPLSDSGELEGSSDRLLKAHAAKIYPLT